MSADPFIARHARGSLIKFGMIPEFIGRLPVFTAVNKLDREALVAVLPRAEERAD